MTNQWYVLHSKPRKEEVAWHQVLLRGIEAFYPCLQVQPVNPRARKVQPYFPGYLFVYADLDQVGLSTFEWMPFVNGLVCFGEAPAPVPDSLVAALQRHLDAVNAAGGEVLFNVQPGDPVLIKNGPFAHYEAIFDTRISGGDRVRVLLQMLNGRSVPLELHVGQIRCR